MTSGRIEMPPTPRPRRKRCTECGELGATVRNLDAADHVHWFHPECWRAFRRWLSGLNEPRGTGDEY
jgi:hypothetical protein